MLSAGRSAPADLRARLALGENGVRAALRFPFTGELTILATCHRTEVYFTGDPALAASLLPDLQSPHVVMYRGVDAIRHLYRVAAGLDSLVVGEPQILTQVRRALVLAEAEDAAGPVMRGVFARAIHIGRTVRTRTALGTFASSIGAVAASHVASTFPTVRGLRCVVVGSGVAATDVATALRDLGARLVIAGRSPAHVARLAARVDAQAFELDDLPALFADADYAVVAVSGGILVRDRHLSRPLPILDLSVPRAVDVGRAPVTTLDDLDVADRAGLSPAIAEAEAYIDREVADWVRRAARRASGTPVRAHQLQDPMVRRV